MKKLPDLRLARTSPEHQARLQRWLQEWRADQVLRGTEPPQVETSYRAGGVRATRATATRFPDAPRAAPVAVGDIRLLQPTRLADERPVYVVVLKELDGKVVIAPFGRFSEPATPGEWITGRQTASLRILCLWNNCTVSRSVVERAWWTDRLTEHELQRALALWDAAQDQPRHADRGSDDVGPPLVHPLDPRWEYLDEETALLDAVVAVDNRGSDSDRGPYTVRENSEIALAAESRGRYTTNIHLRAAGLSASLVSSGLDRVGVREFVVKDESGNVSTLLDGAIVRGLDGGETEPIRAGRVELPHDWLLADLILLMPDGRRLPLTRAR